MTIQEIIFLIVIPIICYILGRLSFNFGYTHPFLEYKYIGYHNTKDRQWFIKYRLGLILISICPIVNILMTILFLIIVGDYLYYKSNFTKYLNRKAKW